MGKRKLVDSSNHNKPSAEADGVEAVSADVSPKKRSLQQRASVHRDNVQPQNLPDNMRKLKIVSWNIPGLRSAIQTKASIIETFLASERPDILCLQETKIQDDHVRDCSNFFSHLGYNSVWSCSQDRKGYSGTAVLFAKKFHDPVILAASAMTSEEPTKSSSAKKKKKQSSLVEAWKGGVNNASSSDVKLEENAVVARTAAASAEDSEHLGVERIVLDDHPAVFGREGRLITVEFKRFFLVAVYVPNSGQNLDRLGYRIENWDVHFREYMHELEAKKPVVVTGDMNCGHLDLDIHNPTAKHIVKQAGLTPQERASFSKMLQSGFTDAFRFFYPEARGQFSYWSQRTFARPVNCGLRLDYFIVSPTLLGHAVASPQHPQSSSTVYPAVPVASHPSPGVLDCYLLPHGTEGCSDHCPIVAIVAP